jgi:hypothetical protein
MLTNDERQIIYQHGYLPEHLTDYVEAVSGADPFLIEQFLCFHRRRHMVFIGYPLGDENADIQKAYDAACRKFKPSTVALVCSESWIPEEEYQKQPADMYYQLKLPPEEVTADVAYMVRRAAKELSFRQGKFSKEHRKLVKAFMKAQDLRQEQRHIFKHIQDYLKRSTSAHLLEVRKENALAAFSIVDTGAADYAFYMFSFRSGKISVPGASDLLFNEMIKLAENEGKKVINLGLGVHTGIRRFKEKWGGVAFLAYNSVLLRRGTVELGDIAKKL